MLSVSAVAQTALASLVRTIARWEREEKSIVPGERYRFLLGYVYACHGDDVLTGPGSDFDELMSAFAGYGVSDERISELRDQIASMPSRCQSTSIFLPPGLARDVSRTLAAPETLSDELVARIHQSVLEVNSRIGDVPFTRLQLALAPAVEASRLLVAVKPPGPIRTRLARTAANTFMIAARIAFEVRDDDVSTEMYARALGAGRSLPLWEQAAIRTSQALVTLYSTRDVSAARAVADLAVRDAGRSDSRIMRSRAHALQAEMAARSRREKHALAGLNLAWCEAQATADADPAAGRFTIGYLEGFEGACNLHLGRTTEAEPQLLRSVTSLDHPRQIVQRAIVTADLALARLRNGAPDSAAELLHDCVNMAATARARVSCLRIAQTRRELRPWRTEPFVADLDDHINETLLNA
ncbi:hypothetical protein [Sphaerisporangium siamense]|uniref:XRE family transcriptional regulator n=1 Tax=Sphaerisporangium siamense TaxID=795645 RepID=A0A7W7D7H1_9ACTN|nr:hypothetical protein [Sphaerisporangium siamense]MBB4700371.1 hypothetical protein [Sphaerisporangium siamense]